MSIHSNEFEPLSILCDAHKECVLRFVFTFVMVRSGSLLSQWKFAAVPSLTELCERDSLKEGDRE